MKITLAVWKGDPKVVDADPVVIPGYEEIKLAVHRMGDNPRLWAVTEVSTGCCLVSAMRTKQAAVNMAKDRLELRGLEWVKGRIAATPKAEAQI